MEPTNIIRSTNILKSILEANNTNLDILGASETRLTRDQKVIGCEECRISFMSHITKIRLKIIQKRIKNKINTEVTEEEFGFKLHQTGHTVFQDVI